MMIRVNRLLNVCASFNGQISDPDEEIESLIVKVAGCLWATGSDEDSIHQILRLVVRSADHGGRRAVSGMIKGWSNAIRSLMALDQFSTQHVGYCRRARNCRFALRKLGASPQEIDYIITTYDEIAGIPPILLLPRYWRVLLPGGDVSLYQAVVPLSNLGRACPIADGAKCAESEIGFFRTTGRIPDVVFNFARIGQAYGDKCKKASSSSHVPLNSHSCYELSRGQDGKIEYFIRSVCDVYISQTIDELVPDRPNSNLFDSLGNLVLRRSDWEVGVPITDVMYPQLMGVGTDGCDRRLGLFGLDWAIRELDSQFPGYVESDAPFLTFGPFIPSLSFAGKLPARVHTLEEEGYKARVITIVMLSVSIIGGVARNFLDDPMRTDTMVKIGLLSKVKLYDFIVQLNNRSRQGVDEFSHPSVFFRTALSADLTTATDTPPRAGLKTLLYGFSQSVSTDSLTRFLSFAIELGSSPRGFESRFCPTDHVHRCGIMMGEGLSGTYLNVMSGIVRCVLHEFMHQFDFYGGETVSDAEGFILLHQSLIQDFLDSVEIDGFDGYSTQSGDDVIFMTHCDSGEIRRFLILLYVIFGEQPSENTFYSSETYGTFTEEAIVRHSASLGWTFVDCLKPRLYSHTDPAGIDPILSRISQITGSLKYIRDEEYIERVCDVVDVIIHSNKVIRNRVDKYHLVLGFPSWLGGIDHPIRLLPGLEDSVPLEDRRMVKRLLDCNLEELYSIKYSWVDDDLPDEEDAAEVREVLQNLFHVFCSLPEGDEDNPELEDLHTYSEGMLLDRNLFPSYNTYRDELESVKRYLGLANLDELTSIVANGLRFRQRIDGAETPEVNPLIRLRNRREVLMSKVPPTGSDGHDFVWSDVQSLHWRMQSSFKGKFVIRDSFLDTLGLLDMPSLSVPISTFVE